VISKDDILCIAQKEYDEAKEKYEKEISHINSWKFLDACKRLEDALLYYEGKLKFKGE
jgi:hypothetical protein